MTNDCFNCDKECEGDFCSDDCRDSYSEKAYEHFLESFYGGDVETLDQQHARLWREKEDLRRG